MQTTYLSELFDDFLFSVSTSSFLKLTDEEIEEDLFYLFKKARAKFNRCRNRLDLITDEEGNKCFGYIETERYLKMSLKDEEEVEYFVYSYNGRQLEGETANEESPAYIDKEKEVKVNLTDFEKNILTHLMLSEYLKPRVMTEEFLRPSMSDKGFKIHSQANHLRELNLLYRLIQKECNKMITEYTYLDLLEGK